MQVGCGRHRHRFAALVISGMIAHHRQHILERKDARGCGFNAGFFRRSVARTLLSSTGFATACITPIDLI
jgi:hypothetical protein